MRRSTLVLAAAITAIVPTIRTASAGITTPVTVTFQQGVDGYAGTFDKRVGSDGTNELGSSTPNYYVDGFSTSDSPDVQGLIRFDNIFGSAPNQIPQGATVLKASLQVTTNGIDPTTTPPGSANAISPGPWGVAGLLRPFDANTSYTDFSALGPTFRNGTKINVSATRSTGFFDDSIGGTGTIPNAIESDLHNGTMNGDEGFRANVQPLVQTWANDPSKANGFTVMAGRTGTTDGWQIGTSSHPDVNRRPKLSVTYTTDAVENFTFQNGVNGYNGTTQNWLRQNNNSGPTDYLDGAQLNEAFLDGPAASSPDDRSMIKFDQLFAKDGGSIPNDAEIVDAYLVVTTGVSSTAARTGGAFTAHQILTDWDTNRDDGSKPSVYGEFSGGFGPTLGTDLAEAADIQWGMISDGQAWFDISSILKKWQAGDPNYGVELQAFMHDDGWQIRFTGSPEVSARPQLVVRTLIPSSLWAADNDGIWNIDTSWQSGRIANGAGRIATFGSAISANRTVTLDANTTVGALKFDNAAASYTIGGESTLTLDRSSGEVRVDVLNGNHTVNVPVVLAKSATFETAAGTSVRFGGALTAADTGVGLTKAGAGTLELASFRGTSLTVNGGRVVMTSNGTDANTNVVNAITVAAGATVDLNDNAVIVDYGSTSPLANVLAAIADGRIVSSKVAGDSRYTIGVIEASDLANLASFRGVALGDATAILIDATLRGDTDLNAKVDFADLLSLAKNYNGKEKRWINGDTDGDADVDFADLLSLAKNYNQSATPTGAALASAGIGEAFAADFALAQSLVPEPTTMVALPLALAGLATRRRSR